MIIMNETKLPDFDDMFKLAEGVRGLTLERLILETEITETEADAIEHGMNHTTINGKPPSMRYLELTLSTDNKLIAKKKKLAEIKSNLDASKMIFDIYKSMIAVWQTESANKRSVSL